MINWILEVEDVEDVACTVDDMEARDSLAIFGSEGMEGGGRGWRWNEDSGSELMGGARL